MSSESAAGSAEEGLPIANVEDDGSDRGPNIDDVQLRAEALGCYDILRQNVHNAYDR
jgi:hypothetical protein